MAKIYGTSVSDEYIEEVFEKRKTDHPERCFGMWTWIIGTLKVKCQGCGYTMRINPKTCKLEHLDSKKVEAVENCSEVMRKCDLFDYEG